MFKSRVRFKWQKSPIFTKRRPNTNAKSNRQRRLVSGRKIDQEQEEESAYCLGRDGGDRVLRLIPPPPRNKVKSLNGSGDGQSDRSSDESDYEYCDTSPSEAEEEGQGDGNLDYETGSINLLTRLRRSQRIWCIPNLARDEAELALQAADRGNFIVRLNKTNSAMVLSRVAVESVTGADLTTTTTFNYHGNHRQIEHNLIEVKPNKGNDGYSLVGNRFTNLTFASLTKLIHFYAQLPSGRCEQEPFIELPSRIRTANSIMELDRLNSQGIDFWLQMSPVVSLGGTRQSRCPSTLTSSSHRSYSNRPQSADRWQKRQQQFDQNNTTLTSNQPADSSSSSKARSIFRSNSACRQRPVDSLSLSGVDDQSPRLIGLLYPPVDANESQLAQTVKSVNNHHLPPSSASTSLLRRRNSLTANGVRLGTAQLRTGRQTTGTIDNKLRSHLTHQASSSNYRMKEPTSNGVYEGDQAEFWDLLKRSPVPPPPASSNYHDDIYREQSRRRKAFREQLNYSSLSDAAMASPVTSTSYKLPPAPASSSSLDWFDFCADDQLDRTRGDHESPPIQGQQSVSTNHRTLAQHLSRDGIKSVGTSATSANVELDESGAIKPSPSHLATIDQWQTLNGVSSLTITHQHDRVPISKPLQASHQTVLNSGNSSKHFNNLYRRHCNTSGSPSNGTNANSTMMGVGHETPSSHSSPAKETEIVTTSCDSKRPVAYDTADADASSIYVNCSTKHRVDSVESPPALKPKPSESQLATRLFQGQVPNAGSPSPTSYNHRQSECEQHSQWFDRAVVKKKLMAPVKRTADCGDLSHNSTADHASPSSPTPPLPPPYYSSSSPVSNACESPTRPSKPQPPPKPPRTSCSPQSNLSDTSPCEHDNRTRTILCEPWDQSPMSAYLSDLISLARPSPEAIQQLQSHRLLNKSPSKAKTPSPPPHHKTISVDSNQLDLDKTWPSHPVNQSAKDNQGQTDQLTMSENDNDCCEDPRQLIQDAQVVPRKTKTKNDNNSKSGSTSFKKSTTTCSDPLTSQGHDSIEMIDDNNNTNHYNQLSIAIADDEANEGQLVDLNTPTTAASKQSLSIGATGTCSLESSLTSIAKTRTESSINHGVDRCLHHHQQGDFIKQFVETELVQDSPLDEARQLVQFLQTTRVNIDKDPYNALHSIRQFAAQLTTSLLNNGHTSLLTAIEGEKQKLPRFGFLNIGDCLESSVLDFILLQLHSTITDQLKSEQARCNSLGPIREMVSLTGEVDDGKFELPLEINQLLDNHQLINTLQDLGDLFGQIEASHSVNDKFALLDQLFDRMRQGITILFSPSPTARQSNNFNTNSTSIQSWLLAKAGLLLRPNSPPPSSGRDLNRNHHSPATICPLTIQIDYLQALMPSPRPSNNQSPDSTNHRLAQPSHQHLLTSLYNFVYWFWQRRPTDQLHNRSLSVESNEATSSNKQPLTDHSNKVTRVSSVRRLRYRLSWRRKTISLDNTNDATNPSHPSINDTSLNKSNKRRPWVETPVKSTSSSSTSVTSGYNSINGASSKPTTRKSGSSDDNLSNRHASKNREEEDDQRHLRVAILDEMNAQLLVHKYRIDRQCRVGELNKAITGYLCFGRANNYGLFTASDVELNSDMLLSDFCESSTSWLPDSNSSPQTSFYETLQPSTVGDKGLSWLTGCILPRNRLQRSKSLKRPRATPSSNVPLLIGREISPSINPPLTFKRKNAFFALSTKA